MPALDTYGSQAPLALLRHILDYKSMYDRDCLEEQKDINDILFMACMNPKVSIYENPTLIICYCKCN